MGNFRLFIVFVKLDFFLQSMFISESLRFVEDLLRIITSLSILDSHDFICISEFNG